MSTLSKPFDTQSTRDWCEILKDLVAMANSGGGVIIIGVDNRGTPVGADVSAAIEIDEATICDKLHRYTETHFGDIEVLDLSKSGQRLAGLRIGPAAIPIVFTKPGTYPTPDGKQHTAFGQGTVYFRHGAKSEPGTTEDIRQVLERKLEEIRKDWLSSMKKVVQAPAGSQLAVLPPDVKASTSAQAVPIRIVSDPSAPAYRVVDPDDTHPHRQKELIAEINRRNTGFSSIFHSAGRRERFLLKGAARVQAEEGRLTKRCSRGVLVCGLALWTPWCWANSWVYS